MRREELIVVMRRIWLSNPLLARRKEEFPRGEELLFINFAEDIVGDLVDDFEIEQALEYLMERKKEIHKERRNDLVWDVIFDGILDDIIASVRAVAKRPEKDRGTAILPEVKEGTCCICGEPLDTTYGNNPEPIPNDKMMNAGARCCDKCNITYVIPVRKIVWRPEEDEMEEDRGSLFNRLRPRGGGKLSGALKRLIMENGGEEENY